MNTFKSLYQDLRKRYGKSQEQWKLWCKRPKTIKERHIIMIEAILTQRTSWNNVEKAMNNLRTARAISLNSIFKLRQKQIERFIKPAGFYKTKATYLFNLAEFVVKKYRGVKNMMRTTNIEKLRKDLLRIKGIGNETADSILLYALDKPVFVIDEYTKRLVKEKHLMNTIDYNIMQKTFEDNLPRNFRLYQDFHALIVINGKVKKHN